MRPSLNPFRSKALLKQRYNISEKALEQLLQKSQILNYRSCIRGPHGTGKSTLLQDMAVVLKSRGHDVKSYYLSEQTPKHIKNDVLQKILDSDSAQINCLDGGETIGWLSWYWFLLKVCCKNKTILVTTHVVSPLVTLHKSQVDQALVLSIIQRLAGVYWCEELKRLAVESFNRNSGNCREVFRDCYMYCSEVKELP